MTLLSEDPCHVTKTCQVDPLWVRSSSRRIPLPYSHQGPPAKDPATAAPKGQMPSRAKEHGNCSQKGNSTQPSNLRALPQVASSLPRSSHCGSKRPNARKLNSLPRSTLTAAPKGQMPKQGKSIQTAGKSVPKWTQTKRPKASPNQSLSRAGHRGKNKLHTEEPDAAKLPDRRVQQHDTMDL